MRRAAFAAKGFTLVEMSVVLVIAGLLIFGISVGYVLKKNATLKSVVDDMGAVNTAVHEFQRTYGGMPGDLWNATDKFGTGTANGNGNGSIDNTEYLLFWQHLQLAGLIKGSYDGATNKPGVGVMKAPYPQAGYYVTSVNNVFRIGVAGYNDTNTSGAIERLDTEDRIAIFTPSDAKYLDNRYDDNDPAKTSGIMYGFEGSSASGTCISGGSYNASNGGTACILEMVLGREN